MKNGILLSTYPDSLGRDLKDLNAVLSGMLGNAVSNVHILPFFPSSGDRGFAPLRYDVVDPAFGTWDDIALICSRYPIMCDFMANHISPSSPCFQDVLLHGRKSRFWNTFLHWNGFWGENGPSEDEFKALYRRRPVPPYTDFRISGGQEERFWTTFSSQQVDMDISSDEGKDFIEKSIAFLGAKGIDCIRLDAVACTTKVRGSSCFFVEPMIYDILAWLENVAADAGMRVLPEIHGGSDIRRKLSSRGYFTYDFALPMLVLHALYSEKAEFLARHIAQSPSKQLTVLDTHDGIGAVDVRDELSDEDIEFTRRAIFSNGKGLNPEYNTMLYGNLDIYQINSTYFSALGEDDTAYLIARAVQFFTPGIPQVYYVGLFAGCNDIELLERTKVGRNINRHGYTMNEIENELSRPVVRRLLALAEFRNTFPAFSLQGEMDVTCEGHELRILRRFNEYKAILDVDFSNRHLRVRAGTGERMPTVIDI